ncbi:MAG: DUF1844 domain-containing protein [Desulfobulbus sp.]|jgi:hypothetical protein
MTDSPIQPSQPNTQTNGCCECPEGQVRDAFGKCVMPTVTFSSLLLSLNTSALFHMGELPHPETGQTAVELELAKHAIDTIALLESKTRGNLTSEESELLTRVLYELKIRYVRLT